MYIVQKLGGREGEKRAGHQRQPRQVQVQGSKGLTAPQCPTTAHANTHE